MTAPASAPRELRALRERSAELVDIRGIMSVLFWDQGTYMPVSGTAARATQMATLERIWHDRLVDAELGRLLEALDPWVAGLDPDSDGARLVRVMHRDHDKAVRVPRELAAEMATENATGQSAWLDAVTTGQFSRFRDALARQVDLRRRYAACFPEAEHPYDALLDDFEPEVTTAGLRTLFAELEHELAPLVLEARDGGAGSPRVFEGRYSPEDQRRTVVTILGRMGFDPASWRLDASPHPFAQSPGPGDIRITTRYHPDDLDFALYSGLHEFGHGLYDEGIGESLRGTLLHDAASLGVHESQSRLWENVVGRGRPFGTWLHGQLTELLPAAVAQMTPDELHRLANAVRPSLIRTEADETTYNLHILLRFELEVALLEGRLEVDGLPDAWNEGMHRLLGVDVPSDTQGVLQDIHWSTGAFGYFPTYTLGNLMAAQLWQRAQQDLPGVEDAFGGGEFAALREWLREHVHRHGRKYPPRDLLRRITGGELETRPFVDYLRAKLADAGLVAA